MHANSKGIWQIVAGVVLVVVGAVLTATGYGSAGGIQLILFGASLVLGGIATLLAPSPPGTNTDKQKSSYLFSNPVNVARQGGPVSILIGELHIGSTVVSASLEATDITSGSDNTDPTGGPPVSGGIHFYNETPTKFPD
jgi:predicted phage tail protein